MTHQHQFILIEQVRRNEKHSTDGESINTTVPGEVWRDENGAKVGCPLCGEIRIIWSSGEIEINVKGRDDKSTRDN